MAGFKMHITTSTVLGVGYGAGGYLLLDVPETSCLLATGLCSLSGMLPDLDSDTGVPLRESIAFTAAVVPMLLIDRLTHLGMDTEAMVLVGGLIYVGIRFGLAEVLKRYTVHRGMWHSLPAAAIAGLLAFLLCSCDSLFLQSYKAFAVVTGFMSHLVLDEIYAIEWKGVVPRFKRSFGTAIKFYSSNTWANISVYAKLAVLVVFAVADPLLMSHFGYHQSDVHLMAKDLIDRIIR